MQEAKKPEVINKKFNKVNINPSRAVGIVKEQIEKEHMARRFFHKRWGKLDDPDLNKFYHPDELNRLLREELKEEDLYPYKYTGEGESYFVSKDMYNELLAKCRCGRQRKDGHLLKCLQKLQNDNLLEEAEKKNVKHMDNENQNKESLRLPVTSNAFFGWRTKNLNYQQWELSMKYFSPVLTMPGHRITDTPYNAIKIG